MAIKITRFISIEHVFSYISQLVYSKNKKYNSINDLWDEIEKSFNIIAEKNIKNLFDNYSNRLVQVIENKGDITKYLLF